MDILVNVANQKLKIATNLKSLVAGTQEFIRFVFNLTSDWDGLSTFAQFTQNGDSYNQFLDEDNSVYLPTEIVAGKCTLMLYGSKDKTIGTTNYITLTIDDNILVSDANSTEISESLYNQLVNEVNSIRDEIQNFAVDDELVAGTVEKYLNENWSEISDAVKTVNGIAPDESGNVVVEIPEGFSGSVKVKKIGETSTDDEVPTAKAVYDAILNAEGDIFVGDYDTTVAEFNEAFASKKACFMIRPRGGSGNVMWVAYNCSSAFAHFYNITSGGAVQHGVLDSNGEFTTTTVDISDDKIAEVVKEYLDENPVEGGDGNALYYSEETNASGIAVVTIQKGAVSDEWTGLSGTPHVGDLVISATGQLFKVSEVDADTMYMGYIMDLKTALPENIVQSVNGQTPDENGNVEINVPEGFSGSWNDLTDKPFGEGYTEVMPEQEFTFEPTVNGVYATMLLNFDSIEGGKTYIVRYDGTEYTSISLDATDDGIPGIILGNAYLAGLPDAEDTGEPFAIAYINTSDTFAKSMIVSDTGSTHTVGIFLDDVKCLDEKYIPDTIARTADVILAPATASIGQTIVVKAVDETGKPTEWEAVDLPSGGEKELALINTIELTEAVNAIELGNDSIDFSRYEQIQIRGTLNADSANTAQTYYMLYKNESFADINNKFLDGSSGTGNPDFKTLKTAAIPRWSLSLKKEFGMIRVEMSPCDNSSGNASSYQTMTIVQAYIHTGGYNVRNWDGNFPSRLILTTAAQDSWNFGAGTKLEVYAR